MKDLVYQRRLLALLVSILLLLLSFPHIQGSVAEDVLLNVLQAAIVVIGTSPRYTATAILLGALSLLSGWVPRSDEYPLIFWVGGVGGVGFYGFAVAMIGLHLLQEREVTFDTLCGGFCGYLLLGFLWTEAYDLIEFHHPHSIIWSSAPADRLSWADLIYFSFSTLTTAAYGDVTPMTHQSRSIALLESVSGVFYVAVMISRLVGMYTANHRNLNGTT